MVKFGSVIVGSWPVSAIVCGEANRPAVSNVIVSLPPSALAWVMAQRKLPALPSSRGFITVKVDGTVRSSSPSRRGRKERRREGAEVERRVLWGVKGHTGQSPLGWVACNRFDAVRIHGVSLSLVSCCLLPGWYS